jgi:hypothetical protein
MLRAEFLFSRQLDRGNPNPGNIGSDFNRLGLRFWIEVNAAAPRAAVWQQHLEELNRWRNAIAHSDYDPAKLGGRIILRVSQVRRWRRACHRLARAFDRVMANHLRTVTGVPPW